MPPSNEGAGERGFGAESGERGFGGEGKESDRSLGVSLLPCDFARA